ncbi:MAG: hypothetical protein ACR2FS_10700 [Phormidesmis sp.]
MLVANLQELPAMKFWLVCFGLLFMGAELWQWLAELGSKQPSGAVLILGGIGLAAVSNAAHLPKLKGAEDDSASHLSSTIPAADASADQPTARQPKPDPALNEAQSERGSISFKVRFPFR